MKLLGSGPDMAAELKDGDRIEGGPEGGLPQRSFGGQAAEFWGISLLGRRCLEGGGMVSKIFLLLSKPVLRSTTFACQ